MILQAKPGCGRRIPEGGAADRGLPLPECPRMLTP